MMELRMPFAERCEVDGQPMVVDPENRDERICLNEQKTHRYYWPDKFKNSGWVLIDQ